VDQLTLHFVIVKKELRQSTSEILRLCSLL